MLMRAHAGWTHIMADTSSGLDLAQAPPLQDARLRALYAYWWELGNEAGGLPPVQAFDPLHLPKILANIWILEVAPDTRRFRMRLAGENINAIYGRNIGGQYFRDLFEPNDLETIIARYTRALGEPAVFHATGSVYAAAGRLTVGERLGLPMLGRSGITDTLLGATMYGARGEQHPDVLITGDVPRFFPFRAANHRAPEIAGG
jgi:hypothetical protein